MKKFNNLNKLLRYKCPICNSELENQIYFASPDYEANIPILENHKLIMFFYSHDNNFTVEINLKNNKLNFGYTNPDFSLPKKFLENQLFLYLNSVCKNCKSYNYSSCDIDVFLNSKEIGPIYIEREYFFIDDYKLEYRYNSNSTITFSKKIEKSTQYKTLCKIKMIKLDFSNKEKLINKIKAIIIFK